MALRAMMPFLLWFVAFVCIAAVNCWASWKMRRRLEIASGWAVVFISAAVAVSGFLCNTYRWARWTDLVCWSGIAGLWVWITLWMIPKKYRNREETKKLFEELEQNLADIRKRESERTTDTEVAQ